MSLDVERITRSGHLLSPDEQPCLGHSDRASLAKKILHGPGEGLAVSLDVGERRRR